MKRQKRTESELQEASNHLHYEYSMLNAVTSGLVSGRMPEGAPTNALLESFVIHVRVLLNFLYPERPKAADVIAADYFTSVEEWDELRPTLSETLKKARIRAYKEVVHLSYDRLKVTPEKKPWAFIDITKEIDSVMNVFLKNIPKKLIGYQWTT